MVPAVKTRLLFRAPPIHGHNRRTGLPSRLPTRSTVTSTGYITNLHSSRGRSDEQRRTSRIRKGELTRRRSLAPVPAPLIISEGIFFFSSHPPPRGALELELRRRRHTGGLQQSVDTITSQVSVPPTIHVHRSHWRYQRGEHSRQSLEQFADNVNSHPTSLGHGDPYQDPKYQTGRGKIPRSH